MESEKNKKILKHIASYIETALSRKSKKTVEWDNSAQRFVVWNNENDLLLDEVEEVLTINNFYAKYMSYIKSSEYYTWYMTYILGQYE